MQRRKATASEALTALTLEARKRGFMSYGKFEQELERTGGQKERERIIRAYVDKKYHAVEHRTSVKDRMMSADWSQMTVKQIALCLGVTEKCVRQAISQIKKEHGIEVRYAAVYERVKHG